MPHHRASYDQETIYSGNHDSPLSILALSPFTSHAGSNKDDNEMLGTTDDEASKQGTSIHDEDEEDDMESISSTSSDYPVLHPHLLANPISPSLLMACLRSRHHASFDPVAAHTSTIARFTAIPFVKGVFNAEGWETGLYVYTDQLLPTVEYTHDFQPIPFSGSFLPVYISQANLIGTTFLCNLKDFQHQICDVVSSLK